ncbi:MAG: MFS transporter [Alphaproteobacteria bacterium]|nr:MFS transporter [Alphaproteobacteria bacterium]
MAGDDDSLSLAGRLGRLTLLFLAHAVGTANITVALATAPAIEQSLGLNHASFGLMISAYYGAILVFSIPAGFIADRFGLRVALILANVLMGLGMGAFSRAEEILPATLYLVLCGAGYALVNPATARGTMVWFPARFRSTAMGVKQTGVPAGGLLAALAAAAVSDWRQLAMAVAALTLSLAAGCALLRLAEPKSAAPSRFADLSAILRLRYVVIFNLGASLYAIAQGAVLAYLVLFARDALEASASLASLCLGIAHTASAAGRIGWGIICDLIQRNGRLIGLLACGITASVAILALVVTPWIGGLAVLPVIAALLGLTVAGYAGMSQIAAAEAVEPRLAGAAIGYNMLLTNGGMMLGPLLFGTSVHAFGYAPSWIGLAIVILVGAGLVRVALLALARVKREGQSP